MGGGGGYVKLPFLNPCVKQKLLSTIIASSDSALLELHDILRQSSCLVGEDVLDLTQLLIQGGGPSLQTVKGVYAAEL